jgi:hypothetical protein
VIGTHRVERSSECGLKGNRRRLGRKAQLVHAYFFAGVMPKVMT